MPFNRKTLKRTKTYSCKRILRRVLWTPRRSSGRVRALALGGTSTTSRQSGSILDQNRQPVRTSALFGWALPENWGKGMRAPGRNGNGKASVTNLGIGSNGGRNGNPGQATKSNSANRWRRERSRSNPKVERLGAGWLRRRSRHAHSRIGRNRRHGAIQRYSAGVRARVSFVP